MNIQTVSEGVLLNFDCSSTFFCDLQRHCGEKKAAKTAVNISYNKE